MKRSRGWRSNILKIPFLTLRRHIELNVYTFHAALDFSFLDRCERSSYMRRPGSAANSKKIFNRNDISISTCYGLIELQKKSLAFKAWQDFEFTMKDGVVNFDCVNPDLFLWTDSHTSQTNGFSERHGLTVVKIESPYYVECTEDIDFVMTPSPFGHQCLCYVGGITNYKYQHATSMFAYFKRSEDGRWRFNAGDDMVNITPMSDRPLKVIHHFDKDYHAMLGQKMNPLTVTNSFLKRRKADQEKSK